MAPCSASTCPFRRPPADEKIILVIDGDSEFRFGLAENLRDDGHEVREYVQPSEVLSLPVLENVGAVISECRIGSGQDGLRFADFFHRRQPDVPIVLLTPYWSDYLTAQAAKRCYLRLCHKPVDYDELHGLLHELSAARSTAPPA